MGWSTEFRVLWVEGGLENRGFRVEGSLGVGWFLDDFGMGFWVWGFGPRTLVGAGFRFQCLVFTVHSLILFMQV